jgi:dihydrolipoamide dehydrogenase
VRLLPGVSLSENVVTYEEQILTRDLPGSIVIVGAGAIGMEFAYVLTNYGVKVTIIEFLDRALPNEDADVSKEIAKQYKNLGVDILVGTKVESVVDSGDKVTVTYTDNKSGEKGQIEADKVLMSIGFAPRVEGFGLENTGVKLTDRGRSRSTTSCARTSRASTRSATSPPSCSSRTSPRRRASSPPRRSAARRRWRSATTA